MNVKTEFVEAMRAIHEDDAVCVECPICGKEVLVRKTGENKIKDSGWF